MKEISMSGKGSRPRPLSVSQKQFAENWDAAFNKYKQDVTFNHKKDDDNTGVNKNEYQDINSTEDCILGL